MTPAFSHRIEVRFRDCDAYQHVNNAVYFTYFEQARLVMAETLGLRRTLDEAGLSLILVHTSCDYKVQVVFGDTIEVRIGVAQVGGASFQLEMEARRVRDDALVATSESVQVVYDYSARRPVRVPDTLREKLEALRSGSPVVT